MKKIELFIPDRRLDDVIEVLKDANIGGMSHYRIEGRGKIKPEEIYVGRGTMTYKTYPSNEGGGSCQRRKGREADY